MFSAGGVVNEGCWLVCACEVWVIECDELRMWMWCSDGNIRNHSVSESPSESESLTSATVTNQKAFDQKACSYNSHSYFCISWFTRGQHDIELQYTSDKRLHLSLITDIINLDMNWCEMNEWMNLGGAFCIAKGRRCLATIRLNLSLN